MARTLLTAIWIDPFGCMAKTPDEEAADLIKDYTEWFSPAKLDTYRIDHSGQLKDGTDLVLFDFGGMSFGNDLMDRNAREIVKWAQDHPSALIIIVSSYTYDHAIKYVIEDDLGLKADSSYAMEYETKTSQTPVYNIVLRSFGRDHYGIPEWFYKWAIGSEKPLPRKIGKLKAPGINDMLVDLQAPLEGKTLPSVVFFKPNKDFVKWMKTRKRYIVDVGCGTGHVAKILTEAKVRVLPIDLLHRDNEEMTVIIANSLDFKFPKNCIVMFCRPCHGFFVENTIDNAVKHKVREFIYVGLPKNREQDLGKYNRRFKAVAKNVGEDGETLYYWRCP